MKTFALSMILALASCLVACRSKARSAPVDFFPASNSVAGWVKSSDTRTFEASRLWQYIDGDADKYVQAGVVKTLTSDYRHNDKTDATVDVYVMGTPKETNGIYRTQSVTGSHSIDLGDAGRYDKGSLTFCQGTYLVRLVAYDDSPEIAKALAELASAISRRLSP